MEAANKANVQSHIDMNIDLFQDQDGGGRVDETNFDPQRISVTAQIFPSQCASQISPALQTSLEPPKIKNLLKAFQLCHSHYYPVFQG